MQHDEFKVILSSFRQERMDVSGRMASTEAVRLNGRLLADENLVRVTRSFFFSDFYRGLKADDTNFADA